MFDCSRIKQKLDVGMVQLLSWKLFKDIFIDLYVSLYEPVKMLSKASLVLAKTATLVPLM